MANYQEVMAKVDAAIKNKDLLKADALLAKLNANKGKRTVDSLVKHGLTLQNINQLAEAIAVFEMAVEKERSLVEKVKILNRIADLIYMQKGPLSTEKEMLEVKKVLEKSVAIDPGITAAQTRVKLCNICYNLGDYSELENHAKNLQLFPVFSNQASLWLAVAYFFHDSKVQGLNNVSYVEKNIDDLNDHDLFWLLAILMQYQELERAQRVIDFAVANNKSNPTLIENQAQIHLENKAYQSVIDLLDEKTLKTIENPGVARRASFSKAKSYEAVKDYASAFVCFTQMNKLAEDSYSGLTDKSSFKGFRAVDLDHLPVSDPDLKHYKPVFMVGFPRSGTTLLDTILDTQDQVRTLSETDGIVWCSKKMLEFKKRYPEDVCALSVGEIDKLRNIYFKFNQQYLPDLDHSSIVIDKLPLNLIHLPFILTLFPDAKIILSLRHPLDVIMSCFQQDFVLNREMAWFTSLENTFTRYSEVMGLFEYYRAKLPLNLLIVRYEDLVNNIEDEAEKVFDFLSVKADERYKEFHTINQGKLMQTPSRSQVTQPLYRSSKYKWKKYVEYLQPYIPSVERFIERYGYDVD
jgi:tetratricopeptide (TPR) repeat protein